LARGRTKRQIALALTISPKTVNAHAEHIYGKIGVTSRGAAALYAMRHGLMAVGDTAELRTAR
jgi:DNA-binding NarL/FixJ family response regulator